jgi:hypothetical protein
VTGRHKWKALRDKFRKIIASVPVTKSGDGRDTPNPASAWPYFQNLLSLRDKFKTRNFSVNFK